MTTTTATTPTLRLMWGDGWILFAAGRNTEDFTFDETRGDIILDTWNESEAKQRSAAALGRDVEWAPLFSNGNRSAWTAA